MKHFKSLFYFTILCFTAFTGLFSYTQNQEGTVPLQIYLSEVKFSQEVIYNDVTESVMMTTYNTPCFYIHNPKEFYIQKYTQFYIAEVTSFTPEVKENNKQIAINKINKNTLQEVITTKNKEIQYKKQAPRLVKIPVNSTQNYASSLGIANKLATNQSVTKLKTKSIVYQTLKIYNTLVTILPNHPKNNNYNNPTLGKYLQNKTPLYNKPPSC